jgi:hypothetical protein
MGNVAVAWSIEPALGVIDASGLYAAPSSIPAKQVVTVTAVNTIDKRQIVSATVTLNPPIEVHVIPSVASLGPWETQGRSMSTVIDREWHFRPN